MSRLRTFCIASVLLLGACTTEDDASSGNNEADTGARADLPSMIDSGQPDASEDAGSDLVEADGFETEWDPGPLELRTREEVCGRWVADRALRERTAWSSGGGDSCDPGTLRELAIEDAQRYTNLYRWLVGLAPVGVNAQFNQKAQACAVIMRGLQDIEHFPPESADCYTEDGAEAASSSNLALGPRHPAPAVDLYMVDDGVESLGHRRWLVNPSYGEAGFGLVDRYSCQWVFSFTGNGSAPYMAFPNPGVAPLTEHMTWWSVTVGNSVEVDLGTRVEVWDVEDGEQLPVEQYLPEQGFGPDTLAFAPSGWSFDRTYEVRLIGALEDGDRETVVYRTTPTRCE